MSCDECTGTPSNVPAPRFWQDSLLEKPGFGGSDEGSLGGAAVAWYEDTTTITITSSTVSITSITIVITSSFHVVNTEARTAAVRSRTALPHCWRMAALHNHGILC